MTGLKLEFGMVYQLSNCYNTVPTVDSTIKLMLCSVSITSVYSCGTAFNYYVKRSPQSKYNTVKLVIYNHPLVPPILVVNERWS